jgi:cardiolipin synthase
MTHWDEEGESGMTSHVDNPLEVLARYSFGRVADAVRYEGNRVSLLRDGTEAFPAQLAAIAAARQFVLLENYILTDDPLGRSFADALAAAAARGVRCRVLYDWLGCTGRTPARFWRSLRAAGVEVRVYNPPRWGHLLIWGNRDHRKLLCVDGDVAFTGGLCLGQEWAGDPARGIPPWRDTAVEIRGPAARGLISTFTDSWRASGGRIDETELALPAVPGPGGDVALWVVPGRPDGMGLYRLELLMAELVERTLWLADAYFVATTAYVKALAGAARAGVDVRLLVPGVSNERVVQALSRASYRPLLEAGVRVFEWNGPMMHAKTAVADGTWSRVGSSNSNLASWMSNRELDVVVCDAELAARMEAMYEQDLANSTEIVLRSGRVRPAAPVPRRTAGRAGRLLAGAVGLGSAVGATLSRHRPLDASEARPIAAAGIALLALTALAFWVPALIAYPLAIAVFWVAVALLGRAWRLYRDGDEKADKA